MIHCRLVYLHSVLLIVFSLFSRVSHAQSKINLEGQWRFAIDPVDEGMHKKWYLANLGDSIELPSTTDIKGIGIVDESPWINYLQRKHKYIGVAWYQKTVDIPENWKGSIAEFFIERTKWESQVWVDGQKVGSPNDQLVTSHIHDLGMLSPGKHILTVRIDNRMIHPIGDKGHNYTEQTESIWNGMVGRIELRKRGIVNIQKFRIFTKKDSIVFDLHINNFQKKNGTINLTFNVLDAYKKIIKSEQLLVQLNNLDTCQYIRFSTKYENLSPWSEFEQPLYYANCQINSSFTSDSIEAVTFGKRELSTSRYKILVNGIPTFIRGNQETMNYPKLGYPPMDVDGWKRIFSIYKAHGFNQVRFHSACPPDAAFQAADELGIYVMVELVWMTSINSKKDVRPISATMGIPQGIGNADRTIDSFVVKESYKILDQYGSHPSFCFYSFGNEMDNLNKVKVNGWLKDLKDYDSRHLYEGTVARVMLPEDDFSEHMVINGNGHIVNNASIASTMESYDSIYKNVKIPTIAHELGQFPVYPIWSELQKYKTTPFKFINLEKSRKLARENGIEHLDTLFKNASGALQQLLYKNDIERELRSRYAAGYNMLSMNDYTGQGEALVGWYDAFYDSKNVTTPELFKTFNDVVVPLARFEKHIFKEGEYLKVPIEINCATSKDFKTLWLWKVTDEDGKIVAKGKLNNVKMKSGSLNPIGEVRFKFPELGKSAKYVLEVYSQTKTYKNKWNFWSYPTLKDQTLPSHIKIVNNVKDLISYTNAGNSVLFVTNTSGDKLDKNLSAFVPVFWSTIFFPGDNTKTFGAYIRNKHPALQDFASDDFLDWQWQDLCDHSRGTVLDGEASNVHPIVQPIDDFHTNRKLGSIYEVRLNGQKVVVCGYDILSDLFNRPPAAQLKYSLVSYLNSEKCHPTASLSSEWFLEKYGKAAGDIVENDETKIIVLYSSTNNSGTVSNQGMTTQLVDNKNGKFSLILHSQTPLIGSMTIQFGNATSQDIKVRMDCREQNFPINENNLTIKVPVFREDFDDGKVELKIEGNQKFVVQKVLLQKD